MKGEGLKKLLTRIFYDVCVWGRLGCVHNLEGGRSKGLRPTWGEIMWGEASQLVRWVGARQVLRPRALRFASLLFLRIL